MLKLFHESSFKFIQFECNIRISAYAKWRHFVGQQKLWGHNGSSPTDSTSNAIGLGYKLHSYIT